MSIFSTLVNIVFLRRFDVNFYEQAELIDTSFLNQKLR